MIGRTVKHYDIVAELGRGGMGMVFRARDTRLDRDVALKFLPPHLSADAEAKGRFIHEAKAASSLDHPNICTIYDIDETGDGQLFIAMAHYEGMSLKDLLEEGPLPAERAIDIAGQVANALKRAHAADIVHRDIKPANIMVTDDGLVKLLDFGIAKLAGATVLTKEGSTLGTVHYMSPEQARAEDVDARSDIWALGAVLYEMVTGRKSFGGEYDQAVIYSILNTEPEPIRDVNAELPPSLEAVVEKALDKDTDRRYQVAEEMLADLEAVRDDLSGAAGTTSRYRLGLTRRQRRRFVRVASVTAVVVLVAVLYFLRTEFSEARPISLAVLPLAAEAADSDSLWFSNGMTDAMITELAHVDNLRVISRNSVMKYRGTEKSLSEIGQELKVKYVVEGSVSRLGDTVTITARLAEAGTDEYIWGQRFETNLEEVLETQSRIAGAVAEEIHGEISPEVAERIATPRKVNPRIYETYLRGMHHLKKLTPKDVSKGLAYLHEAVDMDPGDPRAWAGLAEGYITVGHSPNATPEVWSRARAAAERAITLDSTLAEARSTLAQVKMYSDWDWEGAGRDFRRANELNPSLPMNHYHYAWYLIMTGREHEALSDHLVAEELDPLNPPMVAWTAEAFRLNGRYREAEERVQRALDLGDRSGISQLVLGSTYLSEGRNDEAVAVHEEMVSVNPVWKPVLGVTYARVGRTDDARRIAVEYERSEPDPFSAVFLTSLYGSLGDADRAFAMTEIEPHHGWLPWTVHPTNPLYQLRDDPRFGTLVRRMNLERYIQ